MGAKCSRPRVVTPPKVLEVKFFWADDNGNMTEVTSFEPTTRVFHLVGQLDRKYDDVFTFNWIAEDTGNIAPKNFPIVSVSAPTTTLELFSKAELPRDWPEGLYRVEIIAAGEIIHQARFTVKSTTTQKAGEWQQ